MATKVKIKPEQELVPVSEEQIEQAASIPKKICYYCGKCKTSFEEIESDALGCPNCGFQILMESEEAWKALFNPQGTQMVPEPVACKPATHIPEPELPPAPHFQMGKRYYSSTGASGVFTSDSRCMKCIQIRSGKEFNGQESYQYIYTPSELEWSPTPCCVVDSGKLRALAYEIDRTFLAGLGMPSGKSYDSLNLQSRQDCSFAVGLDDDSVAGLKEIRLKLRELVNSLA